MYIHMYILSESVVLSTATSFHYPHATYAIFLGIGPIASPIRLCRTDLFTKLTQLPQDHSATRMAHSP
jgi:hypothetical protein